MEANALPGADIIILPSGTYSLTMPEPVKTAATTGDLDITQGVTITGGGTATTIIQMTAGDRVIHVIAFGHYQQPDHSRWSRFGRRRGGHFHQSGGNANGPTWRFQATSLQAAQAAAGFITTASVISLIPPSAAIPAAGRRRAGIYNTVNGYVNIDKSTLSGNTAGAGSDGGGVLIMPVPYNHRRRCDRYL